MHQDIILGVSRSTDNVIFWSKVVDGSEDLKAAEIMIGEAHQFVSNSVVPTDSMIIKRSIVDPKLSPWKRRL